MNGTTPTIQIIAPFQAAFEWMKAMLFRPFDLGKWLTVAFAAFIAGSWGGRNFRGINRIGNGDWKYHVTRNGDVDWDITPWIIAAVIGIVVIALVFGIIWMWVSSRGKFIFTDCIVKNRGAIGEPWREYRREGNSFFLFSVVVAIGMMFLAAVTVVLVVLPLASSSTDGPAKAVFVILAILLGIVWLAIIVVFSLISHFMVPVM